MSYLKKMGALISWSCFFLLFPGMAVAQTQSALIADVQVESVTEKSAKITWTSSDANQLSLINFVYGLSTSYDKKGFPRSLSNSVAGEIMYFETNLSNLQSGKEYFFKIQAADTKASDAYTGSFTTLLPDTTKPVMSEISASPQSDGATISWVTDEPSDSAIDYYETGGNVATKKNTEYVTTHHLFVGGLDPDATYNYKLHSTDKAGNEAISDVLTFKTIPDVAPPSNVSDLHTTPFDSSITLKWVNPTDSGFAGVEIFKKVGAPASRSDQKIFSGKSNIFVDRDVVAGKIYYYAVYSKNILGAYSTGAIVADSVAKPVPVVKPPVVQTSTPVLVTTSTGNDLGDKLGVDNLLGGDGKAEESVKNVVAPTLAGVTLVNIFSSISLINLLPLIHLLFFEPFVFIGRRRRIGWGRVYNSITKHPVDLAVVRLIDKQTGKTIQSKVTDYEGRFAFVARPGEYIIRVVKDKFTFPSAYLRGLKDDGSMFDIYFGRTFAVARGESLITANIPIDPPGDFELPIRFKVLAMLEVVQGILSWIGLPLTFLALLISPEWYMWVLLAFQILLFIVYQRISKPVRVKNWGKVYDINTKKPVQRAIVRLYNENHDRLAGMEVTDAAGRYHFIAGNGKYYLVVEGPSHEMAKTPIINLMDRRKQSITMDIGIDLKQDQQT